MLVCLLVSLLTNWFVVLFLSGYRGRATNQIAVVISVKIPVAISAAISFAIPVAISVARTSLPESER